VPTPSYPNLYIAARPTLAGSARKDQEVLPYLFVLNLFIIVFGGGGRRGGCLSGCLFWIVVSVGITIFLNLILLLISSLLSGGPAPGPGVEV
jgi:hypothetical protein